MTRKSLFKMNIADQVRYFNERGQSISRTCKELNISKKITNKFKSHGYEFFNGKFIL
jgi:hypothetical protein